MHQWHSNLSSMTRVFVLILSILTLIQLSACDKALNRNLEGGQQIVLTDSLIVDMLERLDLYNDTTFSIHLSSLESLNDNSATLRIIQLPFKAEDERDLI